MVRRLASVFVFAAILLFSPVALAGGSTADDSEPAQRAPRIVQLLPGLTMCVGETFAHLPGWMERAICDVTVPVSLDPAGDDRTVRANTTPRAPERG